MKIINRFFNSRLWALILKEINQILRNKQLVLLLTFPPTIQLLIYGFALNPDVHDLKLGIVDYAKTYESREMVSALTENRIFIPKQYLSNERDLGEQVRQGKLTAGLVIPPEFKRNLSENKTAEVQVMVDGVDANTAGIATGYINQIISQFSRQLAENPVPPLINPQTIFLYNPGLKSSWFFVPGMMGVVLTLISSLVSSLTVVSEKDSGTLEQLLMTPAEAWEILLAKIVPLFVMIMGDVFLALTVGRLVFGVPFRGNFVLFLGLSGLYVFVGIGIGIMLATLCATQQQVMLTSFFVNLPLIQLSGAIAPIETMPIFFKYLSLMNPLRHYVAIVRGILLKGIGLDVLWPHAIALLLFAIVLLSVSINRFRSQLS
ncbi:MAG TPA: ABC transporter permease [Cyanobacteria bacterium UBA11149]|nr:ABC transporter permease [Cyanobacteria bacterium UBA11367]HBE57923.1 ABC transporter permease [Cyanobacteria bacterium UBA11366]HBK66469.1 ABC transporter permease [Cyanobacteria bacterium UBA11166]HBR76600.1 ABC transporter permease [Cyanobacteria bacterium UBA11159]HBS70633.1 ABC transporter permease [Cyanobacteria bacterium UBA11153]HBW92396.1 ABC transporter permease [Cyanobacteria bacterium UBA11149]HCA95075.1 ABC transporter permease [Cyanobacteria bacterium UBA9226]